MTTPFLPHMNGTDFKPSWIRWYNAEAGGKIACITGAYKEIAYGSVSHQERHAHGKPPHPEYGQYQWGLACSITTRTIIFDGDRPDEWENTPVGKYLGLWQDVVTSVRELPEGGWKFHGVAIVPQELIHLWPKQTEVSFGHVKSDGFSYVEGVTKDGSEYKSTGHPWVVADEGLMQAIQETAENCAVSTSRGGDATGRAGMGHDTEMAALCLRLAHKGLAEEQIYEQWRAEADATENPSDPFTEADFRRHMRNVPAKYEAFKAEHSWPGFTPPPATRTAVATHLSTVEQIPAPPALHVADGDDEPATGQLPGDPREPLNVSNAAVLVDVLCKTLGTGSLEGVFNRADKLVVVPRYGEIGYQPKRDQTAADPPAKIIELDEGFLGGFIVGRRYCYKTDKEGHPSPALPPAASCHTVVKVMPESWRGVPRMSGVTHTPLIRRDGSILSLPGYDAATEMLYLPNDGYGAMEVPENPSAADVVTAREYLLKIVADFPFVTDGDKASYLGALMTPALRLLLPPPWPQLGVNAPQHGSGKTLLATILRLIYGGEERSAPESGKQSDVDEELRKVISNILLENTGQVVVFDNLNGVFRSGKMAKLLTGLHWDDRGLGGLKGVHAINDRLWVLTGNNLQIGGDLARRTIWTSINAGMEHPETRKVTITDLPGWVEANKHFIVQALLVLARAAIPGMEEAIMSLRRRNDCYGRWDAGIRHVLKVAGIEGEFWSQEAVGARVGSDDEEWSNFLAAVWKAWGDQPFTSKALSQACVTANQFGHPTEPSTIGDALPDDLAVLLAKNMGTPSVLNRKLGWWLKNRKDRWADGYCACSDGKDNHNNLVWRIKHAQ